jgi:hypothetical protein
VTRLIIGAQYNTQTTLSGIPAMVIAHVTPIAVNHEMFVNPFATNAVKTPPILSWWYVDITRIDPAQENSGPPHAYNPVVNELSPQLCSSWTLCIRLLQRLLGPMEQWSTSTRPQSTLFTDVKRSPIEISGKL